jgi:hypothetical protein
MLFDILGGVMQQTTFLMYQLKHTNYTHVDTKSLFYAFLIKQTVRKNIN